MELDDEWMKALEKAAETQALGTRIGLQSFAPGAFERKIITAAGPAALPPQKQQTPDASTIQSPGRGNKSVSPQSKGKQDRDMNAVGRSDLKRRLSSLEARLRNM